MTDGSITKKSAKGCPQSRSADQSVLFWGIIIEELHEEAINNNNIRLMVPHADDILLLIEENFRLDIEIKANDAMSLLTIWCKRVKLQISAEKTTYALIKGSLK